MSNLFKLLKNEHLKMFCTRAVKCPKNYEAHPKSNYGQPTAETHPHLLNEGEVTPLITKFEYQNRRSSLSELIAKNSPKDTNHLIVIPAATKQYMSDKIPYIFRQNTEFLYLTGCQEPDCCVVITTSGNKNQQTTLFTRERDEHAERWDGPRTHSEDAISFFGVDQSLPVNDLEKFVQSYKKSNRNIVVWYDTDTPIQNNVHKVMCKFVKGKCYDNPKNFIQKLRLYKSPSEIALMQRACDITAEAFRETISCARPGISENQLYAKIDFECKMRGAELLAYPPVVAGGGRATIIHYINNNQVVNDGEMVLMDAGCEYHGYSSDVTRTWPLNGTFTPEQRNIYEAVYSVQEDLINMCNTLPTLDELFQSMCFMLGKRLQDIGILSIQPSDAYLMQAAYQLCPHHVAHYLGMDIHDTPTISRDRKLEPGMIITIEPGIYITDRNKSIPKEYHDVGVRIEDDILITINGPVVLSRKCPKHIDEIEALAKMNQER